MNAAFLLMSTAALAGADVTPPPAAHAPAVISSGAGCSNCGAPAPVVAAPCGDCGKAKVGLLDKLKARFGGLGKKSHDCGCAPAPVVAAPCHDCGTTVAAPRANLLDKVKGRLGHKKAGACGPVCDPCSTAASPCATAPAAVAPGTVVPPTTTPPVTTPPKEMPKPKEVIPPVKGAAVPLPLPAAPVTGAGGLTGAGNPY